MDKEIQEKLDKLEKLEKGNRARSKKYLDNLKAQGKRQVFVILDDATIDTMARLRGESIIAGKILTYGDIITNAINSYVNIDAKIIPIESLEPVKVYKKKRKSNVKSDTKVIEKDVNIISKDTIESSTKDVKTIVKGDVKPIVKDDINSDKTGDIKDFTHGNAGKNKELYNLYLNKILKNIKQPGKWKLEAESLNKRDIKTPKGLPWTAENLRYMYNNRFKK